MLQKLETKMPKKQGMPRCRGLKVSSANCSESKKDAGDSWWHPPWTDSKVHCYSFFIPGLKHLCRFANQSAHFISAYRQGLSGAQAVWANKKYHGHYILPPDMITYMKEIIPK